MLKLYPDYKTFTKLAQKGNLVPVYAELLADLDTPVSSFLKLSDKGDYAYLLESVEGQEKIGRYSFLSAQPLMVIKSKDRQIEIEEFKSGKIQKKSFLTESNPVEEIKQILKQYQYVSIASLPRFCGGFVGYMAYDMVRFFEKIPDKNKNDLDVYDSVFMLSLDLVIFDHVERKIKIVCNAFLKNKKQATLKSVYAEANKRIKDIYLKLNKPSKLTEISSSQQDKFCDEISTESNFSKSSFVKIVKKAKEYITKGDIIQVVLSQRFKIKFAGNKMDIYRRLRSLNPSPYMYYLKLKGLEIIGASPEMLIRCEDGLIETRPIAGTRPRGKDEKQDNDLAEELLNDKKERAEHLMLVDLGRNDLGRISSRGSVVVKEFMKVEKYSHVMHLVSSVIARMAQKDNVFGALGAAFPAGTVSGAPKIRAMEIIDELENLRRGPYAGCIGYFSFSGNLDTCITIRTILIKNGYCYIQAGAGIVADSVPEKEYKETQNKARALIEAIVG